MVEEFRYDGCRYQMGSLKPIVYLLDKNTTRIDYLIGNYKCEVRNIYATNIFKIGGTECKLAVAETVNERLDFKTDITLKMRENWKEPWVVLLNQLKNGQYYVVIEDTNGVQYIQTPEFTSEFSYTYEFNTGSDSGHTAELKFSCQCNQPVVILDHNIAPTKTYEPDCAYARGGITDFRMTPFQYVLLEADRQNGTFSKVTCTKGEAMHIIDFSPNSFQFRQQYDGRNYQERLTFTIPLSDYKYYWRYNLVEFTENRYAIIFKTAQENWIATGFEFGMMPTYTIETSESVEYMNTITITLQGASQDSIYYCSDRDPEIVNSTTDRFIPCTQPVKDPVTGQYLGYFHCLSKTEAMYTLVQMVTDSGVPTDRYMCLEGYEELYKNLNIIGTYTKDADFGFDLVFENYDCAVKDNCKFSTLSDTIFNFSKRGDIRTMTITNPCPWEIHDLPDWIECDTMSGLGGLTYTVEFSCQENGSDVGRKTSYGILQAFDNAKVLTFNLNEEYSWINPSVHEITARAQSVFSKVNADFSDYDVCEVPDGITAEKVYGQGGVRITVPENEHENVMHQWRIKLCNRFTGQEGWITVIQDHLYTRWEETDEILCVGDASYVKLIKYKGYTPDDINIPTSETRAGEILSEYDSKCMDIYEQQHKEEWVDVDGAMCLDHNLYARQRMRVSEDGGVTWTWTDQYRLSALLEQNSDLCQYTAEYQYKWIQSTEWRCDGLDSFWIDYRYFSEDGKDWYQCIPIETRLWTMRKFNDPECGSTQTDPNYDERWIETTNTVCIDGEVWYLSRLYVSVDGGITWSTTDQYKPTRNSHSSCTERPESDRNYVWCVDFNRYVCNGVDAYYIEVKYYYFADKPDILILVEPEETRESAILKKKNSKECGYVGPDIPDEPTPKPDEEHEWRDDDYTVCDGTNLWSTEREWVRSNGNTWLPTNNYRQKEIIGTCSVDPDDIEYGWQIDTTKFICNGVNLYYTEYLCWRPKGTSIWIRVQPEQWRISDQLVEANSKECGYNGDGIYRWNRSTGETMCDGNDLYTRDDYEVSYDDGKTWEKTGTSQKGRLIETNSSACMETPVEKFYRWVVDMTRTMCVGNDSYYVSVKQESTDQVNWTNSVPEETRASSIMFMKNDPNCMTDLKYRWVDTDEFMCAENNDEYENDPGEGGGKEPVVEWKKEGFVCEDDGTEPEPEPPTDVIEWKDDEGFICEET